MSNVLVVVYSYTGTSRRVAELLCGQQNWPMAEIVELHPRSGTFGTLRCVLDSALRRTPVIRYEGPSPKDFDAVVLVSPIWAQRLAGPMRSFITNRHDQLPDVAVVSVMGGTGAPDAISEITQRIGRAPILSTSLSMHEVDDGSFAARLQAFGTAVSSAEIRNRSCAPPSCRRWPPEAFSRGASTMNGFSVALSRIPFNDVVTMVVDALKGEGLGVLSDIDVQRAIKEKLGAEMGPYRILGACNPQLAHRALQTEPDIGLLLTCNVIVRAEPPDRVVVGFVSPQSLVGLSSAPDISAVAEEAVQRPRRCARFNV